MGCNLAARVMSTSHNTRYLLPRFALRVLSDLAVRFSDTDGKVFVANHFSRTYGPGTESPRGSDERVRIVLAVEAFVKYGFTRRRAARIVSKIMWRTEKRARVLATRYPGYRLIEFRFGRNARGRKAPEPHEARETRIPVQVGLNKTRDERFAELDRALLEERRKADANRINMYQERRCESIRVEALTFKRTIAEFDEFFDRAFLRFCDERASKTRGSAFFLKAEGGYRRQLEWLEEPDQKQNGGYDSGRITLRHGLARLLHEQGQFDAALPLYRDAADRLKSPAFPLPPDVRQDALTTLTHDMEDCLARRPRSLSRLSEQPGHD